MRNKNAQKGDFVMIKKRIKHFFLAFPVVCIFCFSFTSLYASEDVIKWDLSLWGGKRAFTTPLEQWAADMDKVTSGRWKITIHYGGVLAPPKENLDGIQAGMFAACAVCCGYTPQKVPLQTVHELPFISPSNVEKMGEMVALLWRHPAVKKELLKWNAVPLLPSGLTQYQLMGNVPIRTVEDLKGVRIRAGGLIARVLEEFGAVPTMIPAPEVYEALNRGTIDLVAFPWPQSYGSYRLFEVSKYAILPVSLGSLNCMYLANKDAWDALPEEFKKYHLEWSKKAPELWEKQYEAEGQKWISLFKEKLEFIEFPVSERRKLVMKAKEVYKDWAADLDKRGLPGDAILNYYLNNRKKISGE